MYGKIRADVRDILKQLCSYRKIEIVEGAVCADHVHLCLSIPPSEKVCDVVAYLKGKSALMIHDRYPETVRRHIVGRNKPHFDSFDDLNW